ncbi:BtrH N-terminal domain-containing protein [Anaerocolumna sp. AGMB13025]|uniref:BtrH N-terminal domain-containing protein n=1 Tax=Anaerocolumna sp. AGMB13025 TaxID=3039116 RepID=UPI00241CE2C2|nr:BtrH N-terminal domain-containing protein [Anaerocolumna sp. AGMB13025]WFR55649.1 BtrH N-terminal domain-containing protein [Anaerocolumna sp. AGMB13025]
MNTFIPKHTDTYNCLEDVLECLATSYHREHMLMFADAWDFSYYSGDKTAKIGNRVEAGEYNAWRNLEFNHGIKTKYHFTSDMEKQYAILKASLQKDSPVVLWLDGYYVPWTNVYQKLHLKHFVIAMQDEGEDKIGVVDPYWNRKINIFNKELFFLSKAKCITSHLVEEPVIVPEVLVGNAVQKLIKNKHHAFNDMREFAKEVSDSLDLSKELENFEVLIYNCPLFMQLAEVFFRRKNYAKLLHYLAVTYHKPFLEDWSREMNLIGEQWEITREILVSIAKGEHNREAVPEFVTGVLQLADREEALAIAMNQKLN